MPRYVDLELAPVYLNAQACEQIKSMPTADVRPEMHGRWSDKMVVEQMNCAGAHADDIRLGYRCSECGKLSNKTKYCGNCGAKMDREDGDNNG